MIPFLDLISTITLMCLAREYVMFLNCAPIVSAPLYKLIKRFVNRPRLEYNIKTTM